MTFAYEAQDPKFISLFLSLPVASIIGYKLSNILCKILKVQGIAIRISPEVYHISP